MAQNMDIPNVPSHLADYKCYICICYLMEPTLTRCGHRFCKSCIDKWLKTNSSCPVCKNSLKDATDIFPDKFTERRMSEAILDCPYADQGCKTKIFIYYLEEHIKECLFFTRNHKNGGYQCPFASVGCQEIFGSKDDVKKHEKQFTEKHLILLMNKHSKVNMENYKMKRINDKLQKDLESIELKMNNLFVPMLMYNGNHFFYTEELNNFNSNIYNISIDSMPFYTSFGGYKFCANLTTSNKANNNDPPILPHPFREDEYEVPANSNHIRRIHRIRYNRIYKNVNRHENSVDIAISIKLLSSGYDNILKWPCNIKKCTACILRFLERDEEESWSMSVENFSFKADEVNTAKSVLSMTKSLNEIQNFLINDRLWIKVRVELDD